jgi:hypothetical protein
MKHRDNVASAYHNSVLPFTVVWDALHTAVSIVDWSQSKGRCRLHWNWCDIWRWEFFLLKIQNVWHSLGSSSSRMCFRVVVGFRQCWSGFLCIWDFADMCDLWVFTVMFIYIVVLWGMTLYSLVDIRGTHYYHGAWGGLVVEPLVGWTRDRFPMVSLDLSVTFLLTVPWPWGRLSP